MPTGMPSGARHPAGFSNPMTTLGDIITGAASGVAARLAIGTAGHVLTVSSGTPAWVAAPGFANPMLAPGDLIRGGSAGLPTRLPPRDERTRAHARGGHSRVGRDAVAHHHGGRPHHGGCGRRGDSAGARHSQVRCSTTLGSNLLGWQNVDARSPRAVISSRATPVGLPIRLARGTTNQILSVNASGDLLWKAETSGMTNPMSAVGDIIVGLASGDAGSTRGGHQHPRADALRRARRSGARRLGLRIP